MKLALVTNTFPAVSETFIYNHAAGLQRAGLDVTVVAARRSGDAAAFSPLDGLAYTGPIVHAILGEALAGTARRFAAQVARDPAANLALWGRALRAYGFTRRAVRAYVLALPLVDFEVVHFEYSGLAIAWRDALPLLEQQYVLTSCRGAAEQITPLVEPARGAQLRDLFALCDRVHCVSEDMRATCTEYGLEAGRAFVNRPAIDVTRFRRAAPYVARAAGPFRLLSTGRLHWKKGLEFALLAVRALLDQGHDVVYEVIGAGHDEAHLRFSTRDLGLTDRVVFRGKQPSAEVRAALERCDVYLLPSLSEGLSNAALEAMAMELPVVTTTAGGMAEAVTDGVEGRLVAPRDPAAMAQAVAHLLADPAGRAELGRRARRRLEADFTLERQIRVYLAEYAALANAPIRARAPR